MGRHFRNHKMSVWQSLIPKIEEAGKRSAIDYKSHSTLQLASGSNGAAVAGLAPANATRCAPPVNATLLHHSVAVSRQDNAGVGGSYALAVAVGVGGLLCVINGMLLLCLCQKYRQVGDSFVIVMFPSMFMYLAIITR